MKPAEFPESNVVFAKDQEQYLPLPAYQDRDGLVISRWRGAWRERLRFLWTGELWIRTLTFKKPLQPFRPQITSPFPNPPRWRDSFQQLLDKLGGL